MTSNTRTMATWAGLAAVVIAAAAPSGASAAAMTSAEKLYAELAKLSPQERHERIVEGAKKEDKGIVIPVFRGKLAHGHTGLFEKAYPWMQLESADMNTGAAAERLIAEETAGRHLTDAIGVTIPDMNIILEKDLVAHYPTPATNKVLPRYKGFLNDEDYWVPWTWSEHGIAYNPEMIAKADAPKDWFDLCDQRFKGKASYDPGEPKWLVGMYKMLGEKKYEEWTKCIGNNEPILMKGHTTRLQLMMAGDHALSGDQFLYKGTKSNRKNPKKAPFAVVWEAPILARASITTINKNTPHPYSAAVWTDWQLSEESQQFVHDEFRGPLTMSHPYIGNQAELFVYGMVSLDVTEKAVNLWAKNVGSK